MLVDEGGEELTLFTAERPLIHQDVDEVAILVPGPDAESRHELIAGEHAALQPQQPVQQLPIYAPICH